MVRITQEDGIYENLTFVEFILAFIIFLRLYLADTNGNNFLMFETHRNIFFLLLALLFLFCGGEEISWGQRIFNTPTADVFRSNMQNENTIHNMPFFTPDFHDKNHALPMHSSWIRHRLNQGSNNFIALFCYSWLVIVPVTSWLSRKMHRFWTELNLPIVPWWIGGLLIVNNLLLYLTRFYLPNNSEETGIRTVEIKECNLALLFLATGIWFALANRRSYWAMAVAEQSRQHTEQS